VHANIRGGFDQFALFELEKTHNKQHPTDGDEKIPKPFNMLALTFAASPKAAKAYSGAAFYEARVYLDYLAHHFGLKLSYIPLTEALNYPVVKPFDWQRSALVKDLVSGTTLGIIGEYSATTRKNLKLPVFSAGFEIGVDELMTVATSPGYQPLSRFPHVTQDITFRVASDLAYQGLYDLCAENLETIAKKQELVTSIEALDIYQNPETKQKHISFRIDVTHPKRTLKTDEVTKLLDELALNAKTKLQAERI
jgi:phenylalanyl-tRNA synthetase beta subunit